MAYRTRTYELESKDGELTISLSNGMSIQIPPNSKIAEYYAINIRGSKGCVLCFKNDKKEGLGVVDVPYNLIGELEEKLIEMSQ